MVDQVKKNTQFTLCYIWKKNHPSFLAKKKEKFIISEEKVS